MYYKIGQNWVLRIDHETSRRDHTTIKLQWWQLSAVGQHADVPSGWPGMFPDTDQTFDALPPTSHYCAFGHAADPRRHHLPTS